MDITSAVEYNKEQEPSSAAGGRGTNQQQHDDEDAEPPTMVHATSVGPGAVCYEQNTFKLFADTLEGFESECIQLVGLHKPWSLGIDDTEQQALLHKEMTPNGCKTLALQFPNAKVFVDCGSGLGQVPLVMGLVSNMECHGVELQTELHELAMQWCNDCQQHLPGFFRAATKAQAARLHCSNMLSDEGAPFSNLHMFVSLMNASVCCVMQFNHYYIAPISYLSTTTWSTRCRMIQHFLAAH
jgi:hypothetical protein